VVSGTVGFSLSDSQVTGVDVGGGPTVDGTLFTLTLTVQNVVIGTSTVGFKVNAGSFTLAEFTPTSASDTRSWSAFQASITDASLIGLPGISFGAISITVGVNQASGTGATPLNWAQTKLAAAGLTFGGAVTLSVSGTLTSTPGNPVSLFGLVSADSIS